LFNYFRFIIFLVKTPDDKEEKISKQLIRAGAQKKRNLKIIKTKKKFRENLGMKIPKHPIQEHN